jgi:hypothetical protein
MLSIIDDAVVNDLSDQTNWRLGSILVHEGHVQVVHEVDKGGVDWGSESLSHSLTNVVLDDLLE